LKGFGGLGSASGHLGEQVSLLMGELVGGEFVPWPSHTAFGRNREESGGIRRNPEESGGGSGGIRRGVRRNLEGDLEESGGIQRGIQRNPGESGGIRRNPVQIQEFLSGRNSCNKIL
jgi:hypothetical protein